MLSTPLSKPIVPASQRPCLKVPIRSRYPPNQRGYIYLLLVNGRTVPEQRYIMTQLMKRELRHDEIVVHLDSDRANNEPSNLMLERRTNRVELVRLVCSVCGKTFQRPLFRVAAQREKGKTRFYCSPRCIGQHHGRAKKV